MRELRTFTADQMLSQLEDRQTAFTLAKYEHDQAEQVLKSLYASRYLAIKDSLRCSVEDAKQNALDDGEYVAQWKDTIRKGWDMERARNALERVRTAIELWRTEQASLRKV